MLTASTHDLQFLEGKPHVLFEAESISRADFRPGKQRNWGPTYKREATASSSFIRFQDVTKEYFNGTVAIRRSKQRHWKTTDDTAKIITRQIRLQLCAHNYSSLTDFHKHTRLQVQDESKMKGRNKCFTRREVPAPILLCVL